MQPATGHNIIVTLIDEKHLMTNRQTEYRAVAMSFNITVTCLSDQMLILCQYSDAREALDVVVVLT